MDRNTFARDGDRELSPSHRHARLDGEEGEDAQPLISSSSSSSPRQDRGGLFRHGEEEGSDEEEDEEEGEEVDESSLGAPGAFIWGLTLCAGVSGLLFGFDTGVISSTLISIGPSLSHPLTTLEKSLITSSTSFFALLASPPTGLLADTLGRRPVILFASFLFTVGALWQAFSTTVLSMIIGRSIVGAGVGSASFVVPLYISELAPAPFRGRLVTVSSLFITGGQVVAYLVGWAFSQREGGWRWMVGLGAVPAVVQAGMLLFMPETPRFLVQRGRRTQAKIVLNRVYGRGEGMEGLVGRVLRRVEREVREEEELRGGSGDKSWKGRVGRTVDSFQTLVAEGPNRRALVIACMLQGFQQLCGFNSLMYFSATIFRLVGFHSPTLTSLSIAVTNFLFTLVAFWCIDRTGRRRILLLSIPIMVAGLALCALAFSFLDLRGEEGASGLSTLLLLRSLSAESNGDGQETQQSKLWPSLILLSMVIYVASYAIGLGCVPWQQSELFPLSVRALGSALATSTNWFSNTIVGLTFLPMMEMFTPSGTFALYAGVCALAWVTVWRIYPETAGLGLEEVGGLLRDGFGVGESVRGFERRRREGLGR